MLGGVVREQRNERHADDEQRQRDAAGTPLAPVRDPEDGARTPRPRCGTSRAAIAIVTPPLTSETASGARCHARSGAAEASRSTTASASRSMRRRECEVRELGDDDAAGDERARRTGDAVAGADHHDASLQRSTRRLVGRADDVASAAPRTGGRRFAAAADARAGAPA